MATKTTKSITKTDSKRHYFRMTPAEVAQYQALKALLGNGSAAVRSKHPELLQPAQRAFQLKKKAEATNATEFIDTQLQQIGIDSINRLGMIVNSTDERVAQKSVHFVIEQIRGKATQKSISLSGKINVQDVLD